MCGHCVVPPIRKPVSSMPAPAEAGVFYRRRRHGSSRAMAKQQAGVIAGELRQDGSAVFDDRRHAGAGVEIDRSGGVECQPLEVHEAALPLGRAHDRPAVGDSQGAAAADHRRGRRAAGADDLRATVQNGCRVGQAGPRTPPRTRRTRL